MIPLLLFAVIFTFEPSSPAVCGRTALLQPKIRDTADLISHRWLVTATERAGKKTGSMAGANQLYMNFFSNGGFDFVGMGDGDMLVWKYASGSVMILHKSVPPGTPEASFRIEKINARSMQISGMQAGVAVRYFLSHQPGE